MAPKYILLTRFVIGLYANHPVVVLPASNLRCPSHAPPRPAHSQNAPHSLPRCSPSTPACSELHVLACPEIRPIAELRHENQLFVHKYERLCESINFFIGFS